VERSCCDYPRKVLTAVVETKCYEKIWFLAEGKDGTEENDKNHAWNRKGCCLFGCRGLRVEERGIT